LIRPDNGQYQKNDTDQEQDFEHEFASLKVAEAMLSNKATIVTEKCPCCSGSGKCEGQHYDDIQPCLTCGGSGKFTFEAKVAEATKEMYPKEFVK